MAVSGNSDAGLLGPCSPWAAVDDVRARPGCSELDTAVVDDAVQAASEVLYALSGRQFPGECTGYVRPTARSRSWDMRVQSLAGGYSATWGACNYSGSDLAAWAGHSCDCSPPEIELGAYPVTEIVAVLIDGQTIPADEYRIDDYRLLVRVLPLASAQPTVRGGWPTCQRLDLPDSEEGTFSVSFLYGTVPPSSGKRAALALAAELALAYATDSDTRLPERIRSLTRQGESITLIDPQDVLDNGRTGIPEVDLFIKSVNPKNLQRRSTVWSPDTGRARRTTWEST
jgi:hypothetical protein